MERNTKLMIGLFIGILLQIVFISSCKSLTNAEIERKELVCREIAQIREPLDMQNQQLAYEAEKWSYNYMVDQPDSELKDMVTGFFTGKKLSYLSQALEYDRQIDDFKKMKKIINSELKTYIVDKYPNDYNAQLLNYDKQLKSKEYVEGLNKIFKAAVRDKYPNDYCKQEEYFKTSFLYTAEQMKERGYLD